VYLPDVPLAEEAGLVGARPGLKFTNSYRVWKERERAEDRARGERERKAAAKPEAPL
jgi:hypothetical protein